MSVAIRLIGALTLVCSIASAESRCMVEQPTTAGIQSAIDSCAAKGGGIADVPPGTYKSGPLWLKDNVELHLEAGATILLSQNAADWSPDSIALINSNGAKNIAITGPGTIDGNAQYEYAPMRGVDVEITKEIEIARKAGVEMKRYYRTGVQKFLVVLRNSENVRLDGIRLVNSPVWTLRLQDCNQVWIRGAYIASSLEKGVNADGIDIVSTSNVLVSDSIITTGDDAICLKTEPLDEHAPPGTAVKPTENVTVTNSILSSSSSAMVIGTETFADIRHVLFSNIIIRDSNRGVGINVQDGATVGDVRFQNITFELNRRHWNWWGDADLIKFVLKKRTPTSELGRIEDITISGVQGTARGTSQIVGYAGQPLKNITLEDISVEMLPENKPDKRASDALVIDGVEGLTIRNVRVDWDKDSPEPAWGSALVLLNITGLSLTDFRGRAGNPAGKVPAIRQENVSALEQ